jgi:hypothetical protein
MRYRSQRTKTGWILVGGLAVLLFAGRLYDVALYAFLPQARPSPEQEAAWELAKAEGKRRGWEFVRVTHISGDSNRWVISIDRIPPVFGGHAVVEIVDGKVDKYRGGK